MRTNKAIEAYNALIHNFGGALEIEELGQLREVEKIVNKGSHNVTNFAKVPPFSRNFPLEGLQIIESKITYSWNVGSKMILHRKVNVHD
jgi:hypothetical protein